MAQLYLAPVSVNCFGPWLMLQENKIPFEQHNLDLEKGDQEQLKPINPQKVVPTFVDETGFALWEGNAIMRHIARRYKLAQYTPTEPNDHARMDFALDWRHMTLYKHISTLVYPTLFGKKGQGDSEREARKGLDECMKLLSDYLLAGGRSFIGGDTLCLADFTVVPALKLLEVTDYQLTPAVRAYADRFAIAVPSYAPSCDQGLNQLIAKCNGKDKGKTLTSKISSTWEATKDKVADKWEATKDAVKGKSEGECCDKSQCDCKLQGCTKPGCECPGAPAALGGAAALGAGPLGVSAKTNPAFVVPIASDESRNVM